MPGPGTVESAEPGLMVVGAEKKRIPFRISTLSLFSIFRSEPPGTISKRSLSDPMGGSARWRIWAPVSSPFVSSSGSIS